MSDSNKPIIIFGYGKGWFNYLFSDLKNNKSVLIGHTQFCPTWETDISDFFYRLVWGYRFGKKNNQSFLANCVIKYMCHTVKKNFPDGAICLFNRSNKLAHNLSFLKELKMSNPKNTLVYWFTDMFDNVQANASNLDILNMCKNYYDYTITYNPSDAEKYNFTYIETPYSIDNKIENNEDCDIDLLFIGKAKLDINELRFKRIIKIAEIANEKKLKINFSIEGVPANYQRSLSGVNYINFIPYEEIIKQIQRSKCILEVTQVDGTGSSLRLFESIAFNKKLLFTNPAMINHQYYNKNNMQFLDCSNLDNIDINDNFINSPVIPDYETKQEITPKKFIKKLFKTIDTGVM